MSKTKKIKRLENKIKSLQSHNSILEWGISDLIKKQNYKPPSNYYTPRPEIRSSSVCEEEEYNRLLDYLYRAMDKEYQRIIDTEEEILIDDVKFIVYMGRYTVGKLQNVAGLRDFHQTEVGLEFRGHEVVLVDQRDYIHFVRVF